MSTKTAVSLEEYLSTAYEFDPEYVDGELVERTLPTIPHARTQHKIATGVEADPAARLFAAPQARIRTSTGNYRVPDVVVFADRVPAERYASSAPFGVVEVLSPGDVQAELIDKLDEYASAGVSHIWVVDPEHRRIYRYREGSLMREDSLSVPERNLRLPAAAIFE